MKERKEVRGGDTYTYTHTNTHTRNTMSCQRTNLDFGFLSAITLATLVKVILKTRRRRTCDIIKLAVKT